MTTKTQKAADIAATVEFLNIGNLDDFQRENAAFNICYKTEDQLKYLRLSTADIETTIKETRANATGRDDDGVSSKVEDLTTQMLRKIAAFKAWTIRDDAAQHVYVAIAGKPFVMPARGKGLVRSATDANKSADDALAEWNTMKGGRKAA